MKRLIVPFLLLAFSSTLYAQIGDMFPVLEAETVEDEIVTLPDDTKGKYTLLGLAYSKKAEDDLNTWFRPVFNTFIQEQTGLFAGFGYDVNVYFIPMFSGVNAAATGTAKKKAAENIDPDLLPNILFYKGDLKPYKDALDFEKRDTPYFFVLNPEGEIVYATSGEYTSDKMSDVEFSIE